MDTAGRRLAPVGASGSGGGELGQPRCRGVEQLIRHGHHLLVRQPAGQLVGEHGLDHPGPVAGQGGVHGELLGGGDPVEVLAEHRFDPHVSRGQSPDSPVTPMHSTTTSSGRFWTCP